MIRRIVCPMGAADGLQYWRLYAEDGRCQPDERHRRRLTRYGSPCIIVGMNITWQQLIQELRDSGMPMCVIARRCDLSPQAVTDIGSGRTAEPKGFAAVKMYALHARRMRSKKGAA